VRASRTLGQLYPPKFVPTVAANKNMNRSFKLNKPTMGKQIKKTQQPTHNAYGWTIASLAIITVIKP
jgi:hypothetical protein